MKKWSITVALILISSFAWSDEQPTTNENPAYGPTHVRANLQFFVKEGKEAVHFIRETNDPKILTKVYKLQHADPYSIRAYMREMVQGQRVNYNNPAGRSNPAYYNVYNKDNAAKTEKIFVQTSVECVKYNDGTGMLIVSAEDYRFRTDNEYGIGIDELVKQLDCPGIRHSSGQPKYIYFPKNRPASDLKTMISNVGMNTSNEVVELIGGKDKVEVDPELNCLFFNTTNYSRKNVEKMLGEYDISYPEATITFKVYEIDRENDGKIGLDFQSWKNNDGTRLLQTGAVNSRNANLSNAPGPILPNGQINTHYFDFDPKWNSRFLDFLVTKGFAKVAYTGVVTAQNAQTTTLERRTGVMFAKVDPIVKDSANSVEATVNNDCFKFKLSVTPRINRLAATLNINVETVSILGYDSNGNVRTSQFKNEQTLMVQNGKCAFYLGGIEKSQVVRSVSGLPLLKDLPGIGFLFASESESSKKSQLIIVAECNINNVNTAAPASYTERVREIKNEHQNAGTRNAYGYEQYIFDK